MNLLKLGGTNGQLGTVFVVLASQKNDIKWMDTGNMTAGFWWLSIQNPMEKSLIIFPSKKMQFPNISEVRYA